MNTIAYQAPSRNIRSGRAKNKSPRKKRFYKKMLTAIVILLFTFFAFYIAIHFLKNKFETGVNSESSSEYLQLQNPELPNGCEATSLAMALSASGVVCDKLTAYEAVPATDFDTLDNGSVVGANPETAYAGNSATENGFYCFAAPITIAANQILQQNGSNKMAVDITGAKLSELDQCINNNYPVIIWVTKNFESPTICKNYFWIFNDSGEKYFPYSNLHCVMLNSVKNNIYEILDPLSGVTYIEKDLLNQIYTEMGSRAVVIK